MPDVSGASAVNTGVHTHYPSAHQAGALGTRHSPSPLIAGYQEQNSGIFGREIANLCPHQRSKTSYQQIKVAIPA
jgi:hypothetical protein